MQGFHGETHQCTARYTIVDGRFVSVGLNGILTRPRRVDESPQVLCTRLEAYRMVSVMNREMKVTL